MRVLLFVSPLLFVACASSNPTFKTNFPSTDSPILTLENGADRVGCHHETALHGDEFHCGERSVTLTVDGDRYDAQCTGMSKSECEDLLQRMYKAGRDGG